MSPEHNIAQLVAEARYAAERLALYRQRLYGGSGEPRRLAELERIAEGAEARLRAGRDAAVVMKTEGPRREVAGALQDVARRLEAPDLPSRDRMRLLERQAELGDLRDELALRARRRAADGPARA